jgi:hypothetical protein
MFTESVPRSGCCIGADSSFFSPGNKEAARVREDMASAVQEDMYLWLLQGGDEDSSSSSGSGSGPAAVGTASDSTALPTPGSSSLEPKRPVRGRARVAIFDATNTTVARRLALSKKATQKGCDIVFVESICDDEVWVCFYRMT